MMTAAAKARAYSILTGEQHHPVEFKRWGALTPVQCQAIAAIAPWWPNAIITRRSWRQHCGTWMAKVFVSVTARPLIPAVVCVVCRYRRIVAW